MDTKKYEKLKRLLSENKNWPIQYMFKFIVPNNKETINRVVVLLPFDGEFTFKNSKNNKYVSVSCVAQMCDAQKIIGITENISVIPDVMVL